MPKYITIGSNVPMKCYIQLVLLTLLILTLSNCRSTSSMSRMEKLSSMRTGCTVESLDLIITPISFPTMVTGSDSARHKEPFLPCSFHVKGVRTTNTTDNVQLIDSVNQQQESAHEAPPITDSANRLIDNIMFVIIGLVSIFVVLIVFRLVHY